VTADRLRARLAGARPRAERALASLGTAIELLRAIRTRLQIIVVRRRGAVAQRFPAPVQRGPGPRVLAVVTHLTREGRPEEELVERLRQTIDGLLTSLGHTRLELALNTLPGRHVADRLPAYQRDRLTVCERADVDDPLFLGFEAQELFAGRLEEFDWFLFLEDDLVLTDSLLLEKLAFFAAAAPADAVLLPHRYELLEGGKVWIDMRSRHRPDEVTTASRLTQVVAGDWTFAEHVNPHSGFYALSREQVRRWLASGRHWYKLCSYYGPLESAATGCLEECFRIYKPHPDTREFFEIRHYGTRYAELYERRPEEP